MGFCSIYQSLNTCKCSPLLLDLEITVYIRTVAVNLFDFVVSVLPGWGGGGLLSIYVYAFWVYFGCLFLPWCAYFFVFLFLLVYPFFVLGLISGPPGLYG